MKITVSQILVGLALLLTGMGGYLDMCGKESIRIPGTSYSVTKDHLWNDGSFVLFLAVAINILFK